VSGPCRLCLPLKGHRDHAPNGCRAAPGGDCLPCHTPPPSPPTRTPLSRLLPEETESNICKAYGSRAAAGHSHADVAGAPGAVLGHHTASRRCVPVRTKSSMRRYRPLDPCLPLLLYFTPSLNYSHLVASPLAEARCMASPVQGASPAQTWASARPSHAHGHHRRPSTHGAPLRARPVTTRGRCLQGRLKGTVRHGTSRCPRSPIASRRATRAV
jgi:hypothetical protein